MWDLENLILRVNVGLMEKKTKSQWKILIYVRNQISLIISEKHNLYIKLKGNESDVLSYTLFRWNQF